MLDDQLREFFNQQMQKVSNVISANKRMLNNYNAIIADKKEEILKVEMIIFSYLFKTHPDPKDFLSHLKILSKNDLPIAESTYKGLSKRLSEFDDVLNKNGGSKELGESLTECKNNIILYDDRVSVLAEFLMLTHEIYSIAKEIEDLESDGELLKESSLAQRLFSGNKRKSHAKIKKINSLIVKSKSFNDLESINYKEVIVKYESNKLLLDESEDNLARLVALEPEVTGKISRVTRIEKELESFTNEKYALRIFEKAINEIKDKSFLESLINNKVKEISYQVFLDLLLKIDLCQIIIDQFNKTKQSLRNMQDDLERNEHKLRSSPIVDKNFFNSDYENEINRILDRITLSIEWSDKKALTIIKNSNVGTDLVSYVMNTIKDNEDPGGLYIFSSFLNKNERKKEKIDFITMLENYGINRESDINNPFARNMESFEIGVINAPIVSESSNSPAYENTNPSSAINSGSGGENSSSSPSASYSCDASD